MLCMTQTLPCCLFELATQCRTRGTRPAVMFLPSCHGRDLIIGMLTPAGRHSMYYVWLLIVLGMRHAALPVFQHYKSVLMQAETPSVQQVNEILPCLKTGSRDDEMGCMHSSLGYGQTLSQGRFLAIIMSSRIAPGL
jgi:hypothetical protein